MEMSMVFPDFLKGMDATMKNSVFARIRRSTLYVTAWFLLMYLLLLYFGSEIFFHGDIIFKGGNRWLSFLVVGLIILASSLLAKMFQDWFREKRNNGGGMLHEKVDN